MRCKWHSDIEEQCIWCRFHEQHLAQLAKARRTRRNRERGKKNLHKTLGPVNELRKAISALGFKKYNKRSLAAVHRKVRG